MFKYMICKIKSFLSILTQCTYPTPIYDKMVKQLDEINKSLLEVKMDLQYDKELLDAILIMSNKGKLAIKVSEAKAYLANTDYKMLPNYVSKPDEDLDAIIVKRNETREFIRSNNA